MDEGKENCTGQVERKRTARIAALDLMSGRTGCMSAGSLALAKRGT